MKDTIKPNNTEKNRSPGGSVFIQEADSQDGFLSELPGSDEFSFRINYIGHVHCKEGTCRLNATVWLFHVLLIVFSHASYRRKYLNNYSMDHHAILCKHSWFPDDESYRLWRSPDFFLWRHHEVDNCEFE